LTEIISQCYRILGDIESWYGHEAKGRSDEKYKSFYEIARKNYRYALEVARKTSHHAVIIEALLGIGQWYIKQHEYDQAKEFLEEAYDNLDEIRNYKFYKVDVYLAIARLFLPGENEKACSYAKRALTISKEINYAVGQSEATGILGYIDRDVIN
jgi:tetratricopeptide (TPR) repeat protein